METNSYRDDLAKFLCESVKIDSSDLNKEFIEFPARLAYWNQLFADATESYLKSKADWEVAKAATRFRLRGIPLRQTGKLPTMDDLDALVTLDEEVRDVHLAYVMADVDRVRIRGIVESLAAKKDMLQSLGAKVRAEMERDPTVRERMMAGWGTPGAETF